MKNFILALVVLLSLNSSAQNLFQRTYGGYGSEIGYKAIALKNKNFALQGTSGRNTKLIVVDSLGNPKWTKEFSSNDSSLFLVASSFVLTYDSGFVVAATMGINYPSYNTSIVLFKVDSSGDILWTKTYRGIGHGLNIVNEIISTSDSGFAIIGNFEVNGSYRFLCKTDSVGNIQWSKRYDPVSSSTNQSVKQTPDNGFIITGEIFINNTVREEVCLIKTDSAGNINWAKTYSGSQNRDFGKNVIITSDGYFLVTGYKYPYFFLMKTDSSGNFIWANRYVSMNFNYQGLGIKILELSDFNYLVTGISGYDQISDIVLLKTNTAGNIIWSKSYGSDGVDNGNDVIAVGNSYFILGNNSNLARGSSDFYFFEVDSSGYSHCNERDSVFSEDSLILTATVFGISAVQGVAISSDSIIAFDSDTLNYNACGCETPISFFTISSVGPTGVNIVDRSNWGTSWFWDFGNGDTATYSIGHCWIPHNYSVPGIYIISCTVTNACGTSIFSDTVDLVTGINLSKESGIKITVYPNPFSEKANIKINDSKSGLKNIVVYNSLGEEVRKIYTTSDEISFERGSLPTGIYFLKCFINDRFISNRKLMIVDSLK